MSLSRGAGNTECRYESGARIDLKNLRTCCLRLCRIFRKDGLTKWRYEL